MFSYWRDRSVLVTGGCGFLGSHVVQELVDVGADVRVVDNLDKGTLANIDGVRDRVEFLQLDLTDMKSCLEACEDVSVVMNLVGRVHGIGYSSHHHGEMLYHNASTHMNVLEAARRSGVGRFLVVSSSCVYPDDGPDAPSELPVMTGAPEKANEGYGWAKRIAELQAQYYADEFGMEIAICRPVNTYGGHYPWRGSDGSFVIPSLVKRIMDGDDPVVVWGSGNQKRNFLHARDAVRMMMIVTDRFACGRPVNIGNREDVSIAEVVDLICAVSGNHPKIFFDTTKPEGRFRKHVDTTLLQQIAPDYLPEISLNDGIRDVLDWYVKTFGEL